MGFDRARIKENAKTHYSLNKWNNVLVVLIASAASGASSGLSQSSDSDTSLAMAGILMLGSLASLALTICVVNVLNIGSAGWFRKSIYAEKLELGEMFAPFKKNYGDNVMTMFLMDLYIFLWTLLFIIPGFVKAYAYSAVPYIKSENPDLPAGKVIDMSKAMMNGHKMDLFILDLSFLGWHLLSVFTLGILEIVYVGPYYYAARAFAYEEIKADAIARNVINPEDLSGPNSDM